MSVPWLVVSPHCDDAVFGCGALLARYPGSVIVTVFAGTPPSYEPMSEWDRSSGFVPGDDVMASRRAEDERAAAVLRATPLWLDFLDAQYRDTPGVDAVARALHEVLARQRPQAVAFPLGLFHSDHVLAREAVLKLAAHVVLPRCVAYVDALYRRIAGAAEEQISALRQRGYALRDLDMELDARDAGTKRAAVACYRSQLRALATPGRPGYEDAFARERYLELDIDRRRQ